MNPTGFLAHQLLIAMPSISDPNFARSVALVCQHNAHGAFGIVVNRLAPLAIGDVLAQLGFDAGNPAVAAAPVYQGGPVQPERGFVIHDGDEAYDSTLAIAPGLKLTTSRDVLGALAAGRGPRRALLAFGLVWVAATAAFCGLRPVAKALGEFSGVAHSLGMGRSMRWHRFCVIGPMRA